ncbi:hypothetical protein FVE85_6204 [Porphyridium purpureum]|uniref:Uncharacterized protein n=1 Tax=Porphyridium purpureum TaxID=35688 RepID=A0A5J4Z3Q6_PORPP|nr:hypothetical protein FVE85_6204 [Porphyridium purpureum]|eukprot:POR7946..scf295_1
MAFVSLTGVSTVSAKQFKATCAKSASVSRGNGKVIVAAAPQTQEDKKVRPGFNVKNEVLNGRAAMIGFVLALVTEIVSPQHPTLLQQVHALLPFVPSL